MQAPHFRADLAAAQERCKAAIHEHARQPTMANERQVERAIQELRRLKSLDPRFARLRSMKARAPTSGPPGTR